MSNAADLARRLGQEAEAVCRALLPKGCRQGRYWLCGDALGTPGRSLYVRLSGPRSGHWTEYVAALVMLLSRTWVLFCRGSAASMQHNSRVLREVRDVPRRF